MTGAWGTAGDWRLLPGLAAGGAVLLPAALLARLPRGPARRQAAGLAGLAAALVAVTLPLSPPLLRVPVPAALATVPVSPALARPGHDAVELSPLARPSERAGGGDGFAALPFAVAAAVFFPLPWFWAPRRPPRLCQEFLAAAAAATAAARADHADFLLRLARRLPAPAGTLGVNGSSSDLYRRLTMLLNPSASPAPRPSRGWSLGVAGGFLALAVLAGGLGLKAVAAPTPEPAPAAADDEPKKDPPARVEKDPPRRDRDRDEDPPRRERRRILDLPALEEMFQDLPVEAPAREALRRAMEEMRRQIREGALRGQPGLPGLPGLPGDARTRDGRLGLFVNKPDESLVDQLDLPRGQGLVVMEVVPESPAGKAGVRANDILLELNGKAVPANAAELADIVEGLKTDTPHDLVVLRKGKKETLRGLTLTAERPARRPRAAVPAEAPDANVPAVPATPGAGGARQGVMTSVFRADDRFTTRHQEGSLVITITGSVAGGKAKTSQIVVQDGAVRNEYASLNKVPEQYRDKVKNLVEMSEKGAVKVEVRTP